MANPETIPDDINLFDYDEFKYPLLAQIAEDGYIISAKLEAGDCMYIPAWYYQQSKTLSKQTIMLNYAFEESSTLTGLFFGAINEGVLEEQRSKRKPEKIDDVE